MTQRLDPALPVAARQRLLADLERLRGQAQSGTVDPALLDRTLEAASEFVQTAGDALHERSQQDRVDALYRVSLMLGSSLDVQQVLDQVMDAITELTQADRSFLMMRTEDGALTVRAARNLDQQTISAEQFRYSRSVVDHVLDTGEAAVTTNASADPRFRDQPSVVSQQLRFIAAVPMRLRGQVVGAVYADSRSPHILAGTDILPMLEAFAAQAAVAIDHAQIFSTTDAALRERVEELQQLRRMDFQLNASLNEERALSMTLDWLGRICRADAGYAAVAEGEALPIRFAIGAGALPPPDSDLAALWPQAHDVLATRRSFCFSRGGQSIALLPIVQGEQVLAIAALQRSLDARAPFSAEEIDLAERILARAAVVLINARLHAAVLAADEAKTEFVALVAHDLRAPMGPILAYAELALISGRLDPELTDHLERIRDTVYRVDKLISDLADVTRIESGHFFIELARINPIELITELRETMRVQVEARRHTWVELIEPGLPEVESDYYRLLQILTNLISNAIKYTPDGGVITVSAALAPGPERRVAFTVADTGIGMTAGALAQAGGKFWRAGDAFTRTQPGTGLGLYIARRLIEQLGGTLHMASEPGSGSRFTFTMPVWENPQ